MKYDIKMVAVDVDGTFVRSDYSYDIPRFQQILKKMQENNCRFVVASGNQYYQLRDLFPGYHEELTFVAENGAYVKDRKEILYTADMARETVNAVIDVCREYPEIMTVLCGAESAYCQQGMISQPFYEEMQIYYHRLKCVDDLKAVDDRILKFATNVPEEKTWEYYHIFKERLDGLVEPTTSGHGFIDLIVPGCHKASGLKRLVDRWNIDPSQCVAFGDGGNDMEMLQYCGISYAMENAPQHVKDVASFVCPSNNADGVLVTLDELFR